jgi:hypothetical protein
MIQNLPFCFRMGLDNITEVPVSCKLGIEVKNSLFVLTTFFPRYGPFACLSFPMTATFKNMATSQPFQTHIHFNLVLRYGFFELCVYVVDVNALHYESLAEVSMIHIVNDFQYLHPRSAHSHQTEHTITHS